MMLMLLTLMHNLNLALNIFNYFTRQMKRKAQPCEFRQPLNLKTGFLNLSLKMRFSNTLHNSIQTAIDTSDSWTGLGGKKTA